MTNENDTEEAAEAPTGYAAILATLQSGNEHERSDVRGALLATLEMLAGTTAAEMDGDADADVMETEGADNGS